VVGSYRVGMECWRGIFEIRVRLEGGKVGLHNVRRGGEVGVRPVRVGQTKL